MLGRGGGGTVGVYISLGSREERGGGKGKGERWRVSARERKSGPVRRE